MNRNKPAAGTAKAANELGITAEQYRGIQSGAVVLIGSDVLNKSRRELADARRLLQAIAERFQ